MSGNVFAAPVSIQTPRFMREGCLRKWYIPSGFGVPRDAWCYATIKEAAP